MLATLRHRLAAYAAIARPMLVYGLFVSFWAADLTAVLRRFWPRLAQIFGNGPITLSPICGNPQCDFSMFWAAGLAARARQFVTLYDPEKLLALRQHLLNAAATRIEYIYPPQTLLLTMPVSFLPFEPGFLVWLVTLTLAAALCLRWGRLSWPVIACTLLSPAATWNYECGQISLLSAGFLSAALLRMDDAPMLAGVFAGLLIIKPQLGLLAGVAMLATGNWRAMASTAATGLGLAAFVTLLTGPDIWRDYLHYGGPAAQRIMDAPLVPHSYETFGISVFWMLRSLGLGLGAAGAAQSLATLTAAALTWLIWRGKGDMRQKFALTCWAALLAAPYGYTYEMIAASAGLAAIIEARGWRVRWLDPLLWLWPALTPIIASATRLELTPCIVAIALIWFWHAPPEPAAERDIVPA